MYELRFMNKLIFPKVSEIVLIHFRTHESDRNYFRPLSRKWPEITSPIPGTFENKKVPLSEGVVLNTTHGSLKSDPWESKHDPWECTEKRLRKKHTFFYSSRRTQANTDSPQHSVRDGDSSRTQTHKVSLLWSIRRTSRHGATKCTIQSEMGTHLGLKLTKLA